jgi:hypothetical protein
MTLAETLLPRLADWRPAGEGRSGTAIGLPEHGWTVHLTAERVDTVGTLLVGVDVTRDTPVADDAATLETHVRRAAGRVTGLLEPLRLVEIDRVHHVALLRSDGPLNKGDAVSYYEVQFQGRNRVTLARFQASKRSPAQRKSIPFALTHEALAKVVDDLVRE